MTSSEADKFMLEHPEVAVKPIGGENGTWVAWNTTLKHRVGRLWVEANERGIGHTREEAIVNYRNRYHPVKPRYVCGVATLPFEDVSKALRDSVKYRRIVTKFKQIGRRVREFTLEDHEDDWNMIYQIVADDLKLTHCSKCGQLLEKDA